MHERHRASFFLMGKRLILTKELTLSGLASKDLGEFREELRQYWFTPYSRSKGRALDSTGFEHVFVGQTRGDRVTGFHNWLFYYTEELQGRVEVLKMINRCKVSNRFILNTHCGILQNVNHHLLVTRGGWHSNN